MDTSDRVEEARCTLRVALQVRATVLPKFAHLTTMPPDTHAPCVPRLRMRPTRMGCCLRWS